MPDPQTTCPKPLFHDLRSRRVIFVAHCVLNQNARLDGCAVFPNVMRDALEALTEENVGIVQMPCPELMILGLDRCIAGHGEDMRIRDTLESKKAEALRAMAERLAVEIEEYRKNGFAVLGVLRIENSPGCEPLNNALRAVLEERGIRDIPFIGLPENEWAEGATRIRQVLSRRSG